MRFGKLKVIPEVYHEPDLRVPSEVGLWRAVINVTKRDARSIFTRARSQYRRTGEVSIAYKQMYDTLMYEISTEWFDQICEWSGLENRERVRDSINRLGKSLGFFEYDFRPRFRSQKKDKAP